MTIAPRPTFTDFTRDLSADHAFAAQLLAPVPLGRWLSAVRRALYAESLNRRYTDLLRRIVQTVQEGEGLDEVIAEVEEVLLE